MKVMPEAGSATAETEKREAMPRSKELKRMLADYSDLLVLASVIDIEQEKHSHKEEMYLGRYGS
jgi:hypothetical protein